jgi:predicted O-methyltransferase YrrM
MESAKKRGRKPKVKEPIEALPVERHSWNSEDECGLFMASLIKMSNFKTVLEVGVFEGETSKHLINAMPKDGQFIGIDINDYRNDSSKSLMANAGKSVEFILGNSLNEMTKLPLNHFDLIFIDSLHEFDHVLQEFKIAETLINQGGLIILHDTIHLEGPRKVVEYAWYYKYNTVTINTPEGRGITILQR